MRTYGIRKNLSISMLNGTGKFGGESPDEDRRRKITALFRNESDLSDDFGERVGEDAVRRGCCRNEGVVESFDVALVFDVL